MTKLVFGENGKPNRYIIDGKEVTKAEWDEAFPPRLGVPAIGGNSSSGWPMVSEALAVNPKQIKKVMERNRKHNLHINYDIEGRPVLQDRGQRRDLMRIEGAHDQDGGYGDDHATSGGYLDPIGADPTNAFEGL